MVERTVGDLDEHAALPAKLTADHAERIKETYDEPLVYVALQLLEANRRKWLHSRRETNGAQSVERHGLTANQREWLNELQSASRDDRWHTTLPLYLGGADTPQSNCNAHNGGGCCGDTVAGRLSLYARCLCSILTYYTVAPFQQKTNTDCFSVWPTRTNGV